MDDDRPDAEPAFDSNAVQQDAFQTEQVSFYGGLSLAIAGIVYTAVVTVAGVVVALLPLHGWCKVGAVAVYVVGSLGLLWYGLRRGRFRNWLIGRFRKFLDLPEDRG